MKNVTINGNKYGVDGDTPVSLNNGDLVIHYNKIGDVIGAYLVTSFRDHKGRYGKDFATGYCSLINLDNGYIKFEERCSRTTTVARVLSHLNTGDFEAKQALSDGQYIKVHHVGNYILDIQIKGGN